MSDATTAAADRLHVVVLADTDQPSAGKTTHKFLHELGLDVTVSDTTPAALLTSGQRHTDLLLLDLAGPAAQRQAIEDVIAMPLAERPKHVAIMSEQINDELIALRREMNTTKLHLFVKPLHLHGLLGVVRKLEAHLARAAR